MLRKFRIVISVIVGVLLTLYILDFANIIPTWFQKLIDIQLVPAIISFNVLIIIVLLLLTFVFGRIYCSTVCPLGLYQDFIIWLSRKFRPRKRFRFRKPLSIMRWSFLVIVVISLLSGFTVLVGLFDPYSAYARFATNVFKPIYQSGNNLLSYVFTSAGNDYFSEVTISVLSVAGLIVSLLTMLIVGYLAWVNGRIYCNTVCPVGTFLGIISKFSLFKIRINEDTCTSCGVCARSCKSSCIDTKSHQIDSSRCVGCFDCLEGCNENAIKYSYEFKFPMKNRKKVVNASRRRFMMAVGVTGVAASRIFAEKIPGFNSIKTERKLPISPPGSISANNLLQKCTSCHLCVSKCPCQIIKPSFLEYGLGGMMQPMLNFENDYCTFECTICSDVCPTGALTALTAEQKKQNKMGEVHFVMENCLVFTDETNCGRCYNRCPTDAIKMVDYKNDLSIPEVNNLYCVGCGGCEYICPAEPNKAIFVEGISVHRSVKS